MNRSGDYRKDHPSSAITPQHKFWYGYECEGEGSGVCTAVLADQLADDELTLFSQMLKDQSCGQVFFTESFDAWDWYRRVLYPAIKHLPMVAGVLPGTLPAMAVNRLAHTEMRQIRFILRVWGLDRHLQHLEPSDEISIGAPYNMVTWPLEKGVRSIPKQYEQDKAP